MKMENNTGQSYVSNMGSTADYINNRLRQGEKVSSADLQFLTSYIKIFGGKAGNAGKRQNNKIKKQKT